MALKNTLLSISLIMGFASVGYAAPLKTTELQSRNTTMTYDFDGIDASRELNWQPCFESFKCTKLRVPLQYDDPKQGDIDIAYIRYDSKNGTGQDILYNPGGPGASGVSSLISWLDHFIEIFGTDYNFVSFDPRGVNNSGPPLSCGNSSNNYEAPMPMNVLWAQSKANGESCTDFNANTTAKFTGTVANVQDMIHFTALQAKANKKDPAGEKIWYYGVSYGTVIGQTLAALYPDRLGRIILDSNVNGALHYGGYDPKSFSDLDILFDYFFEWCFEAGGIVCPLAVNTTAASDIRDLYDATLEALDYEPAIMSDTYEVVTRYDVESNIFDAAYTPTKGFYAIARLIADIDAGNLTEASFAPSDDDESLGDAVNMVNCIDAVGNYPFETLSDYEDSVNALHSSSSYYWWSSYAFGDALACNGMNITPPESQIFPGFNETRTSIPILFINDMGDPVTPVKSADDMSEYFPGSRVLAVDAPGHSFLGLGSECVNEYARAYLKNGSLPEESTVCAIDKTPAEVFTAGKIMFEAAPSEEKK